MLEVLIGVVIFSVAIGTGFYIGRVFQAIKHPEKPQPTVFNLPEVRVQIAAERSENSIPKELYEEAKMYEEVMRNKKDPSEILDKVEDLEMAAVVHDVYEQFMTHGEFREERKGK